MPRKTEAEIADAMVAILRDRSSGHATIADLIDEIPNRLTLSPEDLAQRPLGRMRKSGSSKCAILRRTKTLRATPSVKAGWSRFPVALGFPVAQLPLKTKIAPGILA